jgi:hypothetical protein
MIINSISEFLKRCLAFFTRPENRCSYCFKKVEPYILERSSMTKIVCEDPDVVIIRRTLCASCIRKGKYL